MVCYNITAYNEIMNFTVSKREVYNSKLRAGIKAERGMVMKGKNLERAVILGLLLSTGVYGTAWAEITNTKFPNEDSVIIEANSTVSPNTQIRDENGNEKQLYDFKNVTVYFSPQGNEDRALGVYSAQYQLTNTNVTVHVGDEEHAGQFVNADGLHLSNHFPKFYVRSYEAYIYGASSDALNLSHDITTDAYVYIGNTDEKMGVDGNGNLKAVIYDGNGIRANASVNGDAVNSITVGGITDITINGSTVTKTQTLSKTELDNILGEQEITFMGRKLKVRDQIKSMSATASYNPAAVYAGNDMYNFECELKTVVEKSGVLDQFGALAGLIGGLLDQVDPLKMGNVSKGQGLVSLNETKLTLNGKGNYGLFAGKNGAIEVDGNLTVNSTGENSYGIAAKNANLIYGDKIIATAELKGIVGGILGTDPINADLELVLDNSENKYGSKIVLNGENNTINMQGENSKAIYVEGVDVNGNSNSVTSGEDGKGSIGNLNVTGDIAADNSGKIDLTVRDWADITGNIEATNGATIKLGMAENTSGISLMSEREGAINIKGNVQAANGAKINLSLGDGANFEGRIDDYKDAGDGTDNTWDNQEHQNVFDKEFAKDVTSSGSVNLTLGNRSTWFVTEQSWVTTVNTDNSIIDLTNGANQNYAVHIGTLNGDAKFIVNLDPNTDAVENNGNMIYVYDGKGAKNLNLQIKNERDVLTGLADGERLRFATVANAGGGFGDTYVARGRGVINSGFSIEYEKYNINNEKENDKYNGGTDFDETKPGSDYVDGIYKDGQNVYLVRDTSKDAGKSDSGATIINMSRANYKNAIYMDRLNKRMGEMRYVNGEEEQGLWVRLRHDRIGQSGDFRSMNTMYELGYDVKQPTDNGEHRIGMAIDYMRGSTTYDDIMGKGETKRYGLWLYDTWLGEKGHYTDCIVKWGHLSNDFDIRDKDSLENITGDYSNNVFSVSAEYGKKNAMGNNWYFEPQAQLQLARVTGTDYVTTQGSKVNVDGINSLIGRAGFRIGRDMDENSTVYLKADLLHEFMGDQTVTAADATGTLREEFENKGTWYDVGFGFAAKMSKNSYAFMDFEKSFGNDNDETYQINAGMQWTF